MYFSFLYFIKNNINKPTMKTIPSPLTVVANEITKNELITSFLLDERNKASPEEINNR